MQDSSLLVPSGATASAPLSSRRLLLLHGHLAAPRATLPLRSRLGLRLQHERGALLVASAACSLGLARPCRSRTLRFWPAREPPPPPSGGGAALKNESMRICCPPERALRNLAMPGSTRLSCTRAEGADTREASIPPPPPPLAYLEALLLDEELPEPRLVGLAPPASSGERKGRRERAPPAMTSAGAPLT